MEPGKVKCPKCEQIVDRVDGEYARHYLIANVICTASKRKIRETDGSVDSRDGGDGAPS